MVYRGRYSKAMAWFLVGDRDAGRKPEVIMTIFYTLDASVIVSAIIPGEPQHETSRKLMDRLLELESPLFEPTLLLPEMAGALRRGLSSDRKIHELLDTVMKISMLTWVSLSTSFAVEASDLAARTGLRGADAVYVTVARQYSAVLVSEDRLQREKATPLATVYSVREAWDEVGAHSAD
jgi:predicted nucleic acid-binding protein